MNNKMIINMDHASWLGFSLSNNNNNNNNNNLQRASSSDTSHFSLLEAFTTASTDTTIASSTAASGGDINVIDVPRGGQEEEEEATDMASATDLSIFNGNPKLEDFLGGSCTAVSSHPPLQQLCHFSSASTAISSDVYDSELKTIAAGFLRGVVGEPTDNQRQQQLQLVPALVAEPTAKKTMDTFGHRTSIFRGVTR